MSTTMSDDMMKFIIDGKAKKLPARLKCYHCDNHGWDSYMVSRPIWTRIVPPGVKGGYSSGFVCFKCLLARVDMRLCRDDFGETPQIGGDSGPQWFSIWFPKRLVSPTSKRRSRGNSVTIEFHVMQDDLYEAGEYFRENYDWLWTYLCQHYDRVHLAFLADDAGGDEHPWYRSGGGLRFDTIHIGQEAA